MLNKETYKIIENKAFFKKFVKFTNNYTITTKAKLKKEVGLSCEDLTIKQGQIWCENKKGSLQKCVECNGLWFCETPALELMIKNIEKLISKSTKNGKSWNNKPHAIWAKKYIEKELMRICKEAIDAFFEFEVKI